MSTGKKKGVEKFMFGQKGGFVKPGAKKIDDYSLGDDGKNPFVEAFFDPVVLHQQKGSDKWSYANFEMCRIQLNGESSGISVVNLLFAPIRGVEIVYKKDEEGKLINWADDYDLSASEITNCEGWVKNILKTAGHAENQYENLRLVQEVEYDKERKLVNLKGGYIFLGVKNKNQSSGEKVDVVRLGRDSISLALVGAFAQKVSQDKNQVRRADENLHSGEIFKISNAGIKDNSFWRLGGKEIYYELKKTVKLVGGYKNMTATIVARIKNKKE